MVHARVARWCQDICSYYPQTLLLHGCEIQYRSLNPAPLMHHHPGLVRAACTARDAYNPALALASAFLPVGNDAALKRPFTRASPFRAGGQKPQAPTQSFTTRSRTRKSTGTAVKAHSGEDGEIPQVRQEKPQKKGTFAGYEALTRSSGENAPQKEQHETFKNDDELQTRWASRTYVVGQPASMPNEVEGQDVVFARPSNFYNRRQRNVKCDEVANGEFVAKEGDLSPQRNGDIWLREGTASAALDSDQHGKAANDWKADMMRLGEQANALAQQKQHLSAEEVEEWKKKMDYEGVPFRPEPSSLENAIPFPWAITPKRGVHSRGTDLLNREIELFMQYMQPTKAEITARQFIRNKLGEYIDANVGYYMKSSYFGSESTGLFSATSDLDFRLRIVGSPKLKDVNDFVFRRMQHLWHAMRKDQEWILAVIRNARYPIINAQHRETGIDIQIVWSPSSRPQADATQHYLERIPNLKPLYFLVKSMFGMRGLADVFNGGTGSYGLLLMLVASLTRRGTDYTHAEPGVQLLQFLDFYCSHDYERNGIALAPPNPEAPLHSTLFRKHGPSDIPRAAFIRRAYKRQDPIRAGQWSIGQARPFQPYLPCIQDPANPLNDLGRKMNAIKHIVATLDQVRTDLRARIASVDGAGQLPEGSGESLLELVVGRCHEVYLERRRRVEEFGLGVEMRRREKRVVNARAATARKREEQKARQVEEQKKQTVQPAETA